LVTQHVVGEALKFKRPGWLTDRKEISWRCAVSLLSKYGVEEHPCCIRDLYANGVYRKALIELGATDAGLLHAAQQDNATLVSDDESLLRWAHIRGVPAFPLSRIHLAAQYP
jgi:predicted nucleic acid-binding protein